jgi:hypothetical protein
MTITILNSSNREYPLTVEDIEDSRAYESSTRVIYIGNSTENIKAFSLCGNYILCSGQTSALREINLEVAVKYL